jgi:hypothetical protein
VFLGACGGGGGEDQFSNEPAGNYPVEVVAAKFPARQRLDQNVSLKLGVRNHGTKTIPALAVTITIDGKEGRASALPFSIRDPQPGLSLPDRPVWLLDDGSPKIAGVAGPGGAHTSNQKTFDFGELKPGDARIAIWRLAAVKAGNFKLRYRVEAGLSGEANAVTANGGGPPIGTFAVQITAKPEQTRVNSKGQIVPVPAAGSGGGSTGTGGGSAPTNPNATSGPADSGNGSYPPSGSLPPSGSG